jgi:hypothetical protein
MICPANLRSIVCASDSGLGDREPLICRVAAITSIQISVIANIDYWSEFGEDLDRLFQASEIQVWKGKGFDHTAWSSLYQ